MTNSPDAQERPGDYSYDMAHEVVEPAEPAAGGAAPTEPVTVTTDTPADQNSDYSYDMAHEEVDRARAGAGGTAPTEPVAVTTETPAEQNGDYSYDMAHDIPASEA